MADAPKERKTINEKRETYLTIFFFIYAILFAALSNGGPGQISCSTKK
jgi:hypothetical protein